MYQNEIHGKPFSPDTKKIRKKEKQITKKIDNMK